MKKFVLLTILSIFTAPTVTVCDPVELLNPITRAKTDIWVDQQAVAIVFKELVKNYEELKSEFAQQAMLKTLHIPSDSQNESINTMLEQRAILKIRLSQWLSLCPLETQPIDILIILGHSIIYDPFLDHYKIICPIDSHQDKPLAAAK